MAAKNNRKLLIQLLLLLAVARLVLVPVFEWQTQKIETINSSQVRLQKAQQVVLRLPEINKALVTLKQQNEILQTNYFSQASLGKFKLTRQQQIEKLFNEHHIRVKNFNWVAELPGEVTELRAVISFEGNTKDFALLQLQIAQLAKIIQLADWSLRIRNIKEGSLGLASGRLTLVAYNVPARQEGVSE